MAADANDLAEPLRSATLNLLAEANAGGVRRAWVISARRSRDEQIALRKTNCGTSDYDVYQKPSGQCRPETAIPGTSKHERGAAVDLGGDLELVERLAPKYGLHAPITGERWHFEYAGDPVGAGDGEAPATSTSSAGGAGGGAGGLSSVPIIGGVLDTAAGWGAALISFVKTITDPKTWLRVLGAIAGAALVIVGLSALGLDTLRSSEIGEGATL